MSYGLDDDFGFDRKPLSQITEDMQDRAKEQFGDDIDLTETSPLSQIINTVALEIAQMWDIAEDVYYSAFLEYASGQDLDRIGMLVGVYRTPAQFSTGEVTINTGNEYVIIKGRDDYDQPLKVATDGGKVFVVTESTEVATSTDSVTVNVQAAEQGPSYNVTADTITEFYANIPSGVESVTNNNATTGGSSVESDASFRPRVRNAVIDRGLATKSSLESAINDVDGVRSVYIEQVQPGEINIYVGIESGYTESDVLTAVDNAVDETKAFGVQANAAESVTGIDVSVQGTITTTDEPGITESDAVDEIESQIISYMNGLEPGDDVVYAKMYDVIYNTADWVYDIAGLNIKEGTGSWQITNISIDSDEIATPVDKATMDISVSIP